jgi:hypothetical protein
MNGRLYVMKLQVIRKRPLLLTVVVGVEGELVVKG